MNANQVNLSVNVKISNEVNGIENIDLAETLSGIYYRYRHGDNMVVL